MEIAVLGGGHGCYAAAAALSEEGHTVRLWRRNAKRLEQLMTSGAIQLKAYNGTRNVPIASVTKNLAAAVDGASVVVIPLPAHSHKQLAKECAPLWRDGQVVFLPPGSFGSYIFLKAARDAGNAASVTFGETGTLPYLARKHGPNSVVISSYAKRLPTGFFPAKNDAEARAILEKVFPQIEPCEDALSAALMNAGPIIHPPLIVMNAGPLEHFDRWDIHNEGTQKSIRRVTDALDAERVTLRETLGYRAPHFPLADHYAKEGELWMYGRGAHDTLTDSGDWRENIDLLTHRYMVEDTKLGLSFLASIGRWVDVEMPLAEAFLAIGGAIAKHDFYAEGRTLESLGLAGKSQADMQSLMYEGL